MVSFHVEVDAKLTVIAAHLIAEDAEAAVEAQMQWRAVAHVDPVDRSHPLFDELHSALNEHIQSDPELIDFHDLRAEGDTQPYHVSFDLVTGMGTRRSKYGVIYKRSIDLLSMAFEGRIATVEVGIEASVDSAPMERKQFSIVPATGK
jgi:divalent metal cation (Fe/Co/Zn/Cd) transporter